MTTPTVETSSIAVQTMRPGYRYWAVLPGFEHAWTIKSVEIHLAEYQVDRGHGPYTPTLVTVTRNDGEVRHFEYDEQIAIMGPYASEDVAPASAPAAPAPAAENTAAVAEAAKVLPESLSTVEVAKRLRTELKAAFPGTRFSVRKDTGTAALWIDVLWTAGPTERAVQAVTARWQGPYAELTDPATGASTKVRVYVAGIDLTRRPA